MKTSIAFQRASHVNSGTSVDAEELPWPETAGRVMRHPLLHLESDPRGEMTHYGGLVLAEQFVRRFGVARRLDEGIRLFKRHAPYHESDHVLALAYTLYADGTCLEDQAALQGSEARSGGWWERVGFPIRPRPGIFCAASGQRKMSSSSRK